MGKLFVLIFLLLVAKLVFAQGEVAETEKVIFKNESSLALVLHSTGYGLNYRYGKRIDVFKKWLMESDLALLKHPKEIKIFNPNFESQKRFIFGKINEVISLKGGIGRQHELYSKFDKGSIAIRYFYTVGGVLTIFKPIYYEMVDSTYINQSMNTIIYYTGTHKFNPSLHKSADVIGKAPFKMGMNELSVVPGIYTKVGISFEYSKTDTMIRAIEGGICLDLFPQRLPIMAIENNPRILLSIFIAYRWGTILDSRKHYSRKSKFVSGKKDNEVGVNGEKKVIEEQENREE